jgi:tRNA-dihydrouridine synthase
MIKRISKTARLISIIQKFGHPVSVKIRLGTNEFEKRHKVYLNLIKSVEPDFFVVHVRTGEQTNKNEPDYSVLPECVETGKTIIANGGINSAEKIELMRKIGVSGVMIGRAAIKNPAVFDALKGKNVPPIDEIKKEYLMLAEKFNAPTKYRNNILQCMDF